MQVIPEKSPGDRIIIFDTTLRDGEQAPGAALTIPEKIAIAHQLARLGVDIIEAGFPISSPAQFEAVERIVDEVQGPTICALARATPRDIESAALALRKGTNTRIHTFIATSDIHLESKFGDVRYGTTIEEKRETVKRMAVDAVTLARKYTDDVEFSAEDAGRTDISFLCEVIDATIRAGATTINIPDTTGYCLPDDYASLFTAVQENCRVPENVVLSTHCHDDLGLAVAKSLAGISAGARQVECTINGIGERAGNAALEEIAMALKVREERFGKWTGIESTLLTDTSQIVSTSSGFNVQPNKAIVGRNAFSHEAGIHQDGVLKRRDTYEIMRAEDVGQTTEAIRLGRHSGRHGLFSRLEKLGFNISADQRDNVYAQFVELADRKKEIYDRDLFHLINEESGPMKSTPHFKLIHMEVSVGTDQQPSAIVRVEHLESGDVREATATGDGPVDALYNAIDHATNEAHDLVNYTIRSVSEGADALGEVSVLISLDGPLFAGRSTGTDVLKASANAYIGALNSLASFRTEEESVKFVAEGIMQSFQGQ